MFDRRRANRCTFVSWLLLSTVLLLHSSSTAFAFEKEIRSLAGQITLKVSAAQKSRIAVIDFADLQGNINDLGRFLADQLSAQLAESATGFQVIDRNNLAVILREHNLSASSLFDMQTTRELGKLSGVNALITGSITPFGDSVKVTLKIIDTDTAKMIGSSNEDIARSNTIDFLLKQGVAGVAGPAGSGRPGGANNGTHAAGNTSPIVAEQNKFTFELQACELSGENISCNLLVKNSAKSRALTVRSSTMLFDDQGNQYFPSSGQIANSLEAFNDHCCDAVRMTLVNEVPVPMSISFQGIAPQASMVSLLTLDCTDGDNANFKVSFRNVSIAQKMVAGIDRSLANSMTPGLSGGGGAGTGGAPPLTVKGMAKNFLKRGLGTVLDRSLEIFDKKLKETVDKALPPPN